MTDATRYRRDTPRLSPHYSNGSRCHPSRPTSSARRANKRMMKMSGPARPFERGNGGLTMKKWLATSLMVALLLLSVVPSYAWRGGTRVFVGVGVAPIWWGYPAWWYYPPPPYYVYAPPTVVEQQPPVYVEQQPAPPAPPTARQFWYYCQPTGAYYPDVQTC